MKKLLIGLALIVPLAACTATERGAAIGGGSGALIGAAVASPGHEAEGALVGGAIGAVAGALVGESRERRGYCEYQDRRGRIYVDRCPDRYRRAYRDDDYYYDDDY
ncbi:MAG: YMGG-like glycine zipper-containing protein [Rhizobiaceae bacterium]